MSSAGGSRGPAAAGETAAAAEDAGAGWRPSLSASLVLAMGLIVTAALAITSLAVYNRNEQRLLNLRVRELSLVIGATVNSVQTPLASAAELANATDGDAHRFREFMSAYVGTGRQFSSASLWPLGTATPRPIAMVGPTPALASSPALAGELLTRRTRPGVLNVTGLTGIAHPSVGIAFSVPGRRRAFVVYAESPLPANRRSSLESNAAFSDLNYAVYLGRTQASGDVVVTSEKHLPLRGRKASAVVPYGAGALTVVVSPRGSLGGSFFRSLPWIIGVVGAVVSAIAALLTERLVRRRRRAERLAVMLDRVAADNRRMYTEQRSISQTLQQALLPESLPRSPALRVSARYVPAAGGVDVGGDWYDVVAIDERRMLLVIGDVSGHGLRAATTMALLRHATLAYVAQDPRPAAVLDRLAEFVASGPHDYFATVLCALIAIDDHRLTIASAGHLAPLIVGGDQAEFAVCDADAPIGLAPDPSGFRESTFSVPAGATVIAFTDGLVERRGEVIDVGLARLRQLAMAPNGTIEDLVGRLAEQLTSDEHQDDTAIVAVQWVS